MAGPRSFCSQFEVNDDLMKILLVTLIIFVDIVKIPVVVEIV